MAELVGGAVDGGADDFLHPGDHLVADRQLVAFDEEVVLLPWRGMCR